MGGLGQRRTFQPKGMCYAETGSHERPWYDRKQEQPSGAQTCKGWLRSSLGVNRNSVQPDCELLCQSAKKFGYLSVGKEDKKGFK